VILKKIEVNIKVNEESESGEFQVKSDSFGRSFLCRFSSCSLPVANGNRREIVYEE